MANELRIEIDHSAFYQWVPVREAEAVETDIDGTIPGFKMRKVVVNVPTTTTTDVDLDGVAGWNADRVSAGLSTRPDRINLIQHLVDGPWEKHFPLSSITAIRASDPKWEKWLNDYFTEEQE